MASVPNFTCFDPVYYTANRTIILPTTMVDSSESNRDPKIRINTIHLIKLLNDFGIDTGRGTIMPVTQSSTRTNRIRNRSRLRTGSSARTVAASSKKLWNSIKNNDANKMRRLGRRRNALAGKDLDNLKKFSQDRNHSLSPAPTTGFVKHVGAANGFNNLTTLTDHAMFNLSDPNGMMYNMFGELVPSQQSSHLGGKRFYVHAMGEKLINPHGTYQGHRY